MFRLDEASRTAVMQNYLDHQFIPCRCRKPLCNRIWKRGSFEVPPAHTPIVPAAFGFRFQNPPCRHSITAAPSPAPAVNPPERRRSPDLRSLGDPRHQDQQRAKCLRQKRKDSSGKRYFVVGKLAKSYGSCKVSPDRCLIRTTISTTLDKRSSDPAIRRTRSFHARNPPMNYPVKDNPTTPKQAS